MTLLTVFVLYAVALAIALRRAGFHPGAGTGAARPSTSPKYVLIVGATGGTGRALVAQALDRGHVVTALARNPKDLALEHPNLRVVPGNVMDYASIDNAMRGQDAVLSALGHRRYLGPTRILSEGTRHLLEAMESHRVPRFVCESSLGIGDSAGRLGLYYTFFVIPVVLPFYFWDKARQERLIAGSDRDWVIVRPGVLTNGARRGGYRHGSRVGSFLSTVRVARADVADFMLNQLTDDAYLRSAPGVSR
jgi:uncharacterized protein YbjT (DUF2867 family)